MFYKIYKKRKREEVKVKKNQREKLVKDKKVKMQKSRRDTLMVTLFQSTKKPHVNNSYIIFE